MPLPKCYLFEEIATALEHNPRQGLRELSRVLGISIRTVEKIVLWSTGKTFRALRGEFLVTRVTHLIRTSPGIPIKELSLAFDFKSSSSFVRALRRACGSSPEELRSSIFSSSMRREVYRRSNHDQTRNMR